MLLRRRGRPLTVTTPSSSSSPVVSDNDDYEQQQRDDNGTDVPSLQRSPLSIDESDDNDDDSLSPGSPSKQTRQRFRIGFQHPRRRGSLLVVFVVVIFCGGYRQIYTKQEFRTRKSSSDDRPPDRRYRNPNLVTDKASHHQQHHLGSITRDEHPQPPSDRRPRIVCIDDSEYCQSLHQHYQQPQGRHMHKKKRKVAESQSRANSKTEPNSHDRSPTDYIHMIENEDCTFSDPSYQAVPMAPSTCNDVHSLSFILPTIGSRSNDQEKSSSSSGGGGGGRDSITSQYLARGGYRDVWALTQPLNNNHRHDNNNDDDDTDDTEYDNGKSIAIAAMKTNRLDKHDWWSIFILEKYRRDSLISERAGRLDSSTSNGNSNHHVVPLYHYCAFSSIVPYSTSGPLDLYVHGRVHDKYNIRTGIMDPIEMFILAMQAARGVYQAHLYNDGYATNAIADIKPPQFLLFTRQEQEQQHQEQEKIFDIDEEDNSDNNNDYNDDDDDDALTMDRTTKTTTQRAMEEYINIPIVQLQDFNRGRYLGRNRTTPYKTCGFQICNIDKFWNFRSPEEYSGLTSNGNENCMYQDDKIDTWALGAVFYFLLSDGRIPFYYIMDNDHHSRNKNNSNNNDFTVVMKMILDGITSKLPEELLSLSDEEEEDVMIMNDMKRKFNLSLKARSKHPAYVALKDVMLACWEYNPEVRPSSLKVVQMLEEMWDKVNI